MNAGVLSTNVLIENIIDLIPKRQRHIVLFDVAFFDTFYFTQKRNNVEISNP